MEIREVKTHTFFGSEIIQRFKTEKFDHNNCVTAQARQAQWREEAETALANLPDPDCPPGHVRQAPLTFFYYCKKALF
jgi:hypothetical protein